jgi:GNAT superfamily N-acetyltransferase
VYAEWIRNSCLGRVADAVWIAEDEFGIMGFLTAKTDAVTRDFLSFPVVTIELAAVVPRVQGLGVASRLMYAALAWAQTHGATAASVGTQMNNAAAARWFESTGFRLVSSSLTLRAWIEA